MNFAKIFLRNQNGTLLADSPHAVAGPRNPAEKSVRDLWVDFKENGEFRFSDTEIGPISDTSSVSRYFWPAANAVIPMRLAFPEEFLC